MSNNGVGYIDLDLLRRRIWLGSMNYTQLFEKPFLGQGDSAE